MDVEFPGANALKRWRSLFAAVILGLLCLRFAHVHLLWADEDYHLAAAIQILHGKLPYRDFWYDKPPLSAAYYLLIGGHAGWPLRILDAAYVALACYLAYLLARQWWGEAEGWVAAFLVAFFTTFYLPSAVIPFAADALMLVPHLAAMYCAARKRAFWAGVWAAVAFLANAKAVFVLAACAFWLPTELPVLLAGFAIPTICAAVGALWSGAWNGYVEQVWRWGFIYARESPVAHPLANGTLRTLNWLGFHAALAFAAVFGWLRIKGRDRLKFGVWLAFSFAAVAVGWRFAPHYFVQLLAPMIVLSSRGVVCAWRERRQMTAVVVSLLLLVPFIRFGPRYAALAYDNLVHREPRWIDVGMDLDSQHAARRICALTQPGDTLFVWGYRPDLYVYTRMISPGRFWDSQPLTGVPADRHLSATGAIYAGPAAAANREELARVHPTWIVDGLSLLNPKLAPAVYPELKAWLAGYTLVGRTKLSLIYRRR
jgi:hypothetical protein